MQVYNVIVEEDILLRSQYDFNPFPDNIIFDINPVNY